MQVLASTATPLLDCIGSTPLLPLHFPERDLTIWAKAEFLNPSGSIKDRFARHCLLHARENGLLRPDGIILECTSGNTGIALAMIGTLLGHQVTILMSTSASIERRLLIRQFGARLILFDATEGYRTGIALAEEMAVSDPRYFLPRQFENPLNAEDHEEQTGREILTQAGGAVDAFVSGYGTGGSLAGVGRALKAWSGGIRIVAMEPAESALLAGEAPCCHAIEGVAGGFIPPLLRQAPIDDRIPVRSADAQAMTRRLQDCFGLPVGVSAGANVVAALEVAASLPRGARVVTLLCDRSDRYFSLPWMNRASPEAAPTPLTT
ncbi:MAG: cysteine synthase family protein [Puniceicoccaceae bacterium]|nr:MAG: cysteine synthase family protein [Puniceicoccaceae bacterium]